MSHEMVYELVHLYSVKNFNGYYIYMVKRSTTAIVQKLNKITQKNLQNFKNENLWNSN